MEFVVIRVRGPEWDDSRPMRDQDGWDEHARFMNDLASSGVILLGGPLGQGERRFLLVFDCGHEDEIRARLAVDPWSDTRLEIESIEPWTILLEAPS